MAIKLVDELKAMGNFPIAHAEGINLVKTDGTEDNLQNLFDNGELGGGDSSTVLTQQEYEALSEEQKLDGLYYTYDTKRIYKNGVQYGASEPIQLTMEEYKALKEAGAIDEQQEYLIEANTEGILLEASDIGYSNAVSNLPCTTVQGAIDKIAETSGNVYSTEETICGTWIDGKPIYRKVITYTLANALTGLVEIAHNIQNIETPIRIVFGKATVPGSGNSTTIPSQYDSTTFIQLGAFSDTYVQLFAGSTNWTSLKEITLCLEYTKTTD